MKNLLLLVAFAAISTFTCLSAEEDSLQMQIDAIENSLNYQTGTIEFSSCKAKLTVPEGFRFLDAKQGRYVLTELWGNPDDSLVLGLLVPANKGVLEQNSWVFTISFDDIGYVKDNDAEDIDYADLLEQMQKETNEANTYRTQMGYQPIQLVGWASQPFYDKEKKVLHWAKELKFGEDSLNTLNYNLRVLGKDGVFVLNAVSSMRELSEVKPTIDKVLTSVEFEKGNTYADFNPDVDKVAAWTIGGLVAGKVLAKVGFLAVLAKFSKLIIVGLGAIGAGVWNFFRNKRKNEEEYKGLS